MRWPLAAALVVLAAIACGCTAQYTGGCACTVPPPLPRPCPQFTVPAAGGDPGAGPAARLSATVVVGRPSGLHACWGLSPGSALAVPSGDRIEFVANGRPTVSGGAVGIEMGSWFATRPTGGRASEPRVVVVLTTTRPGRLEVTWTDCSGAGC